MKTISLLLVPLLAFFPPSGAAAATAKPRVVATTTDIGAIVKAIGGGDVELTVIAKGTQDPHFIEAKPSYMVKMRDADLVVSNGLSLEVGWLPGLIRGARNPKLASPSGHLVLGEAIRPIEVPRGTVTRAMGDVHPDGNPHFTLDPVRVGEVAAVVAARLGELDPPNKDGYARRAKEFRDRLETKTAEWKKRLDAAGVKKVVTHHKTLAYFLARFGLESAGELEPKPGVPPTAKNVLDLVARMKAEKVKLILVENYFDTKAADRIAADVPGAKVASIGVAVESAPGLAGLDDVTEQLVRAIEGAK